MKIFSNSSSEGSLLLARIEQSPFESSAWPPTHPFLTLVHMNLDRHRPIRHGILFIKTLTARAARRTRPCFTVLPF
jgi:hypothetical protein